MDPRYRGTAYQSALFMCKNAEATADLYRQAGYTVEAPPPQEVMDHFAADLRLAHYLKHGN